ncbi:CP2 transcription factor-domain-containing protein [Coemansia mojavensis]|nr:CP2 transcription factor-domain-containing protein [Coemansia mojavensis]
MQFRCVLEAPTAAAQKADESSLTYLNKGQLYGISIMDTSSSDAFYSTTLRIAFHEDSHRKSASTYWNFWLNQQENPRAARAIELDKAGSIGVLSAENRRFDRVTFQWQGQRGAKVMIRFNCLSTDFSRIKGVKGIPLRIHIDTHEALSSDSSGLSASIGQVIERCYARIKLFRDKGAERKNKDDLRHLDKMWEKQKAKLALNGSSTAAQQQQLNEFRNTFAPVQEATLFCEYTLTGDECDNEEPVIIDDSWPAGAASIQTAGSFESPGSSLATPADILAPNKRQFSPSSLSSTGLTGTLGPNNVELVGVDPTYVPMPRKRKAVLVIYVHFQGENIYRAVYLEQLTVEDLVAKLAQRLEMQTNAADVEVVRRTKKGLTVKVDDSVVAQLEEEQDMEVECSFAADSGALTIYLNY